MTVERVFNFAAGPATLPLPVLEEAREALLSLGDTGIGILEHSHRGKAFLAVYEEAVALVREVGGVPDTHDVLFLQGGASLQFAMVPMNFLGPDAAADYLVSGSWGKKAWAEARKVGDARVAATSEAEGFTRLPRQADYSEAPVYVHFTSNNTIEGTQYRTEPEIPAGSALVCDASSDVFSRPLDVSRYGLLYAGAQKNLGPAGVTLVLARRELVERGRDDLPTMLQYRTFAASESMHNTPPTFGIYVLMLVLRWIRDQGGLAALGERNRRKAARLYEAIDRSALFRGTADRADRSDMNVTFVTGSDELDRAFVAFAQERGLDGLKGHRSVGGMRASIYNAFPEEGVEALVEAMDEFERRYAA
jgi:phosphoserine aminotransferase